MSELDTWKNRIVGDSSRRAEWLELRRQHVTGSEVAALLGRHEYLSLETMRREKETGVSDFDASQDHVRQGTLAEGFVLEYLRAARFIAAEPCGLLIHDPVEPALAATPDAIAGRLNVQVKWTMARRGEENVPCKPATGRLKQWGPCLPAYIWYQVQAEMAVLARQESLVVAYHRKDFPRFGTRDDQLGVYLVNRDDAVVEQLRTKAREFIAGLNRRDEK